MKIAVVGSGLWGAAAARHLAKAGCNVTLIGPGEPEQKSTHQGIFASHYDEGRITRKNALDPYWCGVSIAAIDRYAEIQAESGIEFYTPCGAMMAGLEDWMARVDVGREDHAIECDILDDAGLADRFPYFQFPRGFKGYHEPTRAGHVSPRRLVAAQRKAAVAQGAVWLDAIVEEVSQDGTVHTADKRLSFDKVLVAAGYNTDAVLKRDTQLDVYARTVAFFEVSEEEAHRLADMPTLVWDTPDDPYLLPPIRYPDGKLYIKLGGDPEDVHLDGSDAIHDWFRSGGNAEVRDHLEQEFRKLMPSVDIKGVSMSSCVTTWTKDRLPEIAHLSERVVVATGGNGAGAKCSDEIGRLGAALVMERIGEPA